MNSRNKHCSYLDLLRHVLVDLGLVQKEVASDTPRELRHAMLVLLPRAVVAGFLAGNETEAAAEEVGGGKAEVLGHGAALGVLDE